MPARCRIDLTQMEAEAVLDALRDWNERTGHGDTAVNRAVAKIERASEKFTTEEHHGGRAHA